MVTIIFQISDATPIIRLLLRVISDVKVTCNYLSDIYEILFSNQLENGDYKDDIYFSSIFCHAYN